MNKMTTQERAEFRKLCRQVKAQGGDVTSLAQSPEQYDIACRVKFGAK